MIIFLCVFSGGHGLGLSIVGGSDTVLGSVVIHEVYPDGAAANDGRLKPGDQLIEVRYSRLLVYIYLTTFVIIQGKWNKINNLYKIVHKLFVQVNGQSLRNVTHDQAINMLRHTPAHVRLVSRARLGLICIVSQNQTKLCRSSIGT